MTDTGRWEREVVNTFRDNQIGAMRAPSSGSGTGYAVADIIFGKPVGRPVLGEERQISYPEADESEFILETCSDMGFIEHKKSGTPYAYYTEMEVRELQTVARAWGGTAYLGARYTRTVDGNDKVHYLIPASGADQIESGKFRVHADTAEKQATIIVNASSSEVWGI